MAPTGTDSLLAHPDFARLPVAAALRTIPLGFVDVGARGGAHPVMEPVAGATAVLAFDPDADALAGLRAGEGGAAWAAYDVDPNGLAAFEGEAMLHLCTAPTNHSLRPTNAAIVARYAMAKFLPAGTVTVPVTTLDAAIFGMRQGRAGLGEVLKIDTQGTEHEVLTGAVRTLGERTVAVLAEVAFLPIYEGQALFSDVEALLRGHGFSFLGFTAVFHRSRKRVDKRRSTGRERWLYADALFVKDPLPGGGGVLDDRGKGVLFTVELLFGYFDFALEVADDLWADAPTHREAAGRLVADLSRADPAATGERVAALAATVAAAPGDANVLAGRFVDSHRTAFDYSDVPD